MSKFIIQDDHGNRIIELDTQHKASGMPLPLVNISLRVYSNENSSNAEIIIHYELANKIFEILASLCEGNKNG